MKAKLILVAGVLATLTLAVQAAEAPLAGNQPAKLVLEKPGQPEILGRTNLIWEEPGQPRRSFSLFSDGRFGNDQTPAKDCRWSWDGNVLVMSFPTQVFHLTPIDVAGRFTATQTGLKQGEVRRIIACRIEGLDGGHVLSRTQRILDGLVPTALEKQADKEAKEIVAAQLGNEQALVEQAARRATNAAAIVAGMDAALASIRQEGETNLANVRTRGQALAAQRNQQAANLDNARAQEENARAWALQCSAAVEGSRGDPRNRQAALDAEAAARAAWANWQDRRVAAEQALARMDDQLQQARDQYDRTETEAKDRYTRAQTQGMVQYNRAVAEVQNTQAEYQTALTAYNTRFAELWLPAYQERKAALKEQERLAKSRPWRAEGGLVAPEEPAKETPKEPGKEATAPSAELPANKP